jgi:hypothetical protein
MVLRWRLFWLCAWLSDIASWQTRNILGQGYALEICICGAGFCSGSLPRTVVVWDSLARTSRAVAHTLI